MSSELQPSPALPNDSFWDVTDRIFATMARRVPIPKRGHPFARVNGIAEAPDISESHQLWLAVLLARRVDSKKLSAKVYSITNTISNPAGFVGDSPRNIQESEENSGVYIVHDLRVLTLRNPEEPVEKIRLELSVNPLVDSKLGGYILNTETSYFTDGQWT